MAKTVKIKSAKTKRVKFDKWEIEGGVDTLIRAEEIKINKPLMAAVKKAASKREKALKEVVKPKRKA